MRQLRLFTLTICGLLWAAALARAHDMAFPGPPPGGMAGGPPPGAMMGGMYPGMQPVYAPYAGPGYAGPEYGGPPYGGPGYGGPGYGGPGYGGPGLAGPFGPGGEEDAADPGCCDEGAPLWSVSAEAVLLRRTRAARGQTLIRQGSFNLAGLPLLTTNGLNFDYEMAPRFTALLHASPDLDYEVTYVHTEDWSAAGVAVGSSSVSVSAPNILLDNFNAGRFDYTSEFWSAELNVRWRMMPKITLLLGGRFMELDDRFEQTDNFANPATFGSSYTIAVRNRLMGVQGGALFSLLKFGPVSFDGFVKAGYFSNQAEHNMHDIQNFGFGQLEAFNTENTSLWEGGFNLNWCVNRYVKLWLGYDVLWLNKIASAPGQIAGNDLFGAGLTRIGPSGAVGVDVSETMRIDGFNAGLELTY